MSSFTEPQEHSLGERTSLLGRTLGRYEVLTRLAAGGMASVYVGRALGMAGFERLVAIKVLHPHLAHEREFIAMFLDEARLAARIRHPNVVPTLDVHDTGSEGYFLVMDYVEGDHLGTLVRREARQGRRLPAAVVVRLILDALAGLSAAHRLTDDDGRPLHVVHRDISPHNLLVGVDGVCRLTDFGVAKAEQRLTQTHAGQAKGKLGYMAPEQAGPGAADQRADLFGMGVVLWEALTSCRLFRGENMAETLAMLLDEPIPPPSSRARDLAPFDGVLRRALMRDPDERFQTADEFADALEHVARGLGGPASTRDVTRLVESVLSDQLVQQRKAVKQATDALGPVEARSTPSVTPTGFGAPQTGSEPAVPQPLPPRRERESDTPLAPYARGRDAVPPPPARRRAPYLRLVVTTFTLLSALLGAVLLVSLARGASWPALVRVWQQVRVATHANTGATHANTGATHANTGATHAHAAQPAATQQHASAPSATQPERSASVLLQSTPPGAMVARDGVLVGNTPLQVPVPEAGARTLYDLTLAGYDEVAVSVTRHSPAQVDVTLSPRRAPERTAPAPRTLAVTQGPRAMEARAHSAMAVTTAPRARGFEPDVMDPWE